MLWFLPPFSVPENNDSFQMSRKYFRTSPNNAKLSFLYGVRYPKWEKNKSWPAKGCQRVQLDHHSGLVNSLKLAKKGGKKHQIAYFSNFSFLEAMLTVLNGCVSKTWQRYCIYTISAPLFGSWDFQEALNWTKWGEITTKLGYKNEKCCHFLILCLL